MQRKRILKCRPFLYKIFVAHNSIDLLLSEGGGGRVKKSCNPLGLSVGGRDELS